MGIKLINPYNQKVLIREKDILKDDEDNIFPLIRGAYRFVEKKNYTDNFGFQWNQFDKTQIDKQKKISQSKTRFFATTQWEEGGLKEENILEVGSGAGRFSQIVLDYTQANLYSVDYSAAVEANFRNNQQHQNRLTLFQASIYEMPFTQNSFDKVFCFGVLQHTPDFKKSVKSLIDMAKIGGEVVVDFYPIKGWWTKIHAKYIFRPFTKKMKNERLLKLIKKNAGGLIKSYFLLHQLKLGVLTRFIPICDIKNTFPPDLDNETLREWVILDTFDMFSPAYDNPQKLSTVKKYFEEFGMKKVKAEFINFEGGNTAAVVKGIKGN